MRAEERRQAIRELLQNSKQPVSASALASASSRRAPSSTSPHTGQKANA